MTKVSSRLKHLHDKPSHKLVEFPSAHIHTRTHAHTHISFSGLDMMGILRILGVLGALYFFILKRQNSKLGNEE